MNFKTTIVLIALLAFAGVAVFVTRDSGKIDDAASKSAEKVFELADGDVVKVSIAPAVGTKLVVEKTDGKWRLTEPVKAPAEAFEVDSLVRALAGLESRGEVRASTADAKATGLDNPRYIIEITDKTGKTHTLLVGDKTGVGDNLYVSVKDKPGTRVVMADLVERLDKPAAEYRDKKLVSDYSTANVGKIEIVRPDGKLVLTKSGDQWSIVEPAPMPAEHQDVDDIVFALTGLRGDEFVSEDGADAKLYQLDQPRITATLSAAPSTQPTTQEATGEQATGATRPGSVPSTAPSVQPIVIKFGRYDDVLKKNVMVMTSQSPVIAKTPARILETIGKKPLELRDKKVLDIEPAEVSSFSVTSDLAATTKPTSRPASKSDVSVRRRKVESLVLLPSPATTVPTTAPATAPATTQAITQEATGTTRPGSAPATKPAGKWELADGKRADDAKVDQLLSQLHPLRVRKYIEKAPATQPTATYTLKLTTEGPGGTPVKNYEIVFVDPGSGAGNSGTVVGTYNGLAFEVDRFLLDRLSGDFVQGSKPAGGVHSHEAESFDPSGLPPGIQVAPH